MSNLKERLGLIEKIHVGVGVDRRRMRPPPGCMIVEITDEAGNMLMLEVIEAEYPAPPGSWSPESGPSTIVNVGETGFSHQAFSFELGGVKPEYMPDLPDRFMEKVNIGATRAYVFWSCEENK